MTYITDYSDLLIKQYWEKSNAKAEIELKATLWERNFTFQSSWSDEFDIDLATGDRLDLIGKEVGLKRTDGGETWVDDDYRFYLRLKISNNVFVGWMVNDDNLSIQDVIQFGFSTNAVVTDRQDMTLELLVYDGVDESQVSTIIDLNLLPKPSGVRYAFIEQLYEADMFGVSDDGLYIQDFVDGFGELGLLNLAIGNGNILAIGNGNVLAFNSTTAPYIIDDEGGKLAEVYT